MDAQPIWKSVSKYNRKVSLVVQHVLEECPELNHFKRVWPIKALIQQFLKNSSELKRVSARRREERLARLPREEPQALSVANTTSASNSMTKSTSTRKLGSVNNGTASRKGSTTGARKSSEPTGKGLTTGAGKSSEPTGKLDEKEDARGWQTLEDVPAPMHAKRASSKAGATNKSAPRKTAPKKADPELRKSKRQVHVPARPDADYE
ncbi:hypothetical protein JB92DRAFT_2832785 [Gautieria morchelliformis]|nr:hypothetical protein JB92DRAFT_2832785 [Gautieria morchelliformis]